jgi:arylsulfatase A-like enzyme
LHLSLRKAFVVAVLVTVAGLVLAACERRTTHEPPNNTLDYPSYDETLPNSGNATYAITQDRGYENSLYAAKAHYTGSTNPPTSRAYGGFNVKAPDGYRGKVGGAFYFPSGTFTGPSPNQEGEIDILRWDGPESNFGAIRIGSDHKARLIRGKPGTTEAIGDSFTLQEGCWNWLQLDLKLSEEPWDSANHAVNGVYLNGRKIIESKAPNKYSIAGGADTVRFGLPYIDTGTGASQQNDRSLDVYIDDVHISPWRLRRPGSTACAPPRPNILFIVTDDQRADDTMHAMPNTLKWFRDGAVENGDVVAGGTEFSEGYATTPLCCPARASILTGRYAHNHGVRNNDQGDAIGGGLAETQLQSQLKLSGYRTGIAGKYLNDWNTYKPPPYFDKYWISNWGYRGADPNNIQSGGYFNNNGTIECRLPGDTSCTYNATYIKSKALEFINESEGNDTQPWFLYLAPYAPHVERQYPFTSMVDPAAPVYNPPPPPSIPSRNEGPLSDPAANASTNPIDDKPNWVQDWSLGVALLAGDSTWPGGPLRTQSLRALRSVDDMIDSVFDRLKETGEERDTIAFFISDNGIQWREHGLAAKEVASTTTAQACPSSPCGLDSKGKPYTESIKVPFFMRWPANENVPRGVVDFGRLVANIDLAPTALQAAGQSVPPTIDGRSLFDFSQVRSEVLTEGYRTGERTSVWASLRGRTQAPTREFHYIEYYAEDGVTIRKEEYPRGSGTMVEMREYYDLVSDPYELNNLYRDTDPAPPNLPDQAFLDSLSQRLRLARACSGSNCPPQGNGGTADTLAPRVWFLEPTDGSVTGASGRSYFFGVDASDNIGVKGVDFFVDGALHSTDATTPYGATVGPFAAGTTHVLKAAATDAANNRTEAQITVTAEAYDVQATNINGYGPWDSTPGLGTMESGDYITYFFDRAILPTTVLSGWDGSPRSVTLRISPDDPFQRYHDTLTVVEAPNLGTVDLGSDNFWGWRLGSTSSASALVARSSRSRLRSRRRSRKRLVRGIQLRRRSASTAATSTITTADIGATMTMAADRQSVRITMNRVPTNPPIPRSPEHNTMVWEPPTAICGPPSCRITESLEGRATTDGEF